MALGSPGCQLEFHDQASVESFLVRMVIQKNEEIERLVRIRSTFVQR
jgi:hypothetical protein